MFHSGTWRRPTSKVDTFISSRYYSPTNRGESVNHSFVASFTSEDKCRTCGLMEFMHTDKAECQCCPNIGPVEIRFGNMAMCESCWDKNKRFHEEIAKPESQQARVDAHNAEWARRSAIEVGRQVDSSIEVRTDLFNAATVSIVELKKSIDENPDIVNKPYFLAQELKDRFEHFKSVVFDLNQQLVEASNNQKAIQVYLNQLANSLRADEREKLKIADINYQPSTKKVAKPKTVKTTGTSKKLDKVALRKYAAEIGISEFILQSIVVQNGCTVEAAADIIRASIAAAKTTK